MKINLDNVEYDCEFILPEFKNVDSIDRIFSDWSYRINKQNIIEKRELRIKKLNEINAKSNNN